jgi:hypothetical protein
MAPSIARERYGTLDRMRILLPPSEGKASGGRGRPLSARTMTGPLDEARLTVLKAVSAWSAADPANAAHGLALPVGSAAHDLAANVGVLDGRTMPALDRFQGVVYEGLAVATMTGDERRAALRNLLIASGGFGLLAADEPVPEHRVPMAGVVPGVGGLAAYWRERLADVLPTLTRRHLVVDLRSSDYLGAPPVTAAVRPRVLAVRVVTERAGADGPARSVVSWSSKHTKGRIARALVAAEAAGERVRTVENVVGVLVAQGFRLERGRVKGQPTLEVVLTA